MFKRNKPKPLLSPGHSNAKTIKSDALGDYLTQIMYLSSASISGKNVCPDGTPACRKFCIYFTGHGLSPVVQKARLRRTRFFFEDRKGFFNQLESEIEKAQTRAEKQNKKLALRLNGTSDLYFERIRPALFEQFPKAQWYEYSKSFDRMFDKNLPRNLDLTYSRSERTTDKQFFDVLEAGFNVAVVFRHSNFPKTYRGYPVVNGEEHDLRFLDQKGCVVALTAKGPIAKADKTGFVVDYN